MLFHFETKRRWQITIVSPNHDTVEETARPGARSLACNTSKSPVSTDHDDNVKSPISSRYPRDPVEEDWPSFCSASRPKHRSSLRKICRFLIDVHRMYDRRVANVSHSGLPPPPYKQFQNEELPTSSVHEFADPLLTTPELDGYAPMSELQGSAPETGHYSDICGGYSTFSANFDATSNCGPHVGYTIPHPLTPIETPRVPWNLNTEQHLTSFPGTVSGGRSQKSSPTTISPVTPDLNTRPALQPYPYLGFPVDTVSPQSLVSPPDDHWIGLSQVFPMTRGYTSHSSFGSSLDSSPTETSRTYTQSAEQLQFSPAVVSSSNMSHSIHSAESYVINSKQSFASQSPVLNSQRQPHGDINISPGVYEYHEQLGWYRPRPFHEPNCKDVEKSDQSRLTSGQPELPRHLGHSKEHQYAAPLDADNGFYQAPQAWPSPPQEKEDTRSSSKPCVQCDKVFHGRYRVGNWRRHTIAFHSPVASAVKIACRECKRVYKRVDAKRKHEWKKHRIPDAKPKKRTK